MDNFNNSFNGQDKYNVYPDDLSGNAVVFSVLAYFNLLFLIGLLVKPECNNPFVRHHVNNGILLAIASYLLGAVLGVLAFVPLVGVIALFVGGIVGLAIGVFAIIGIINAATGKRFEMPFLSGIKIVR